MNSSSEEPPVRFRRVLVFLAGVATGYAISWIEPLPKLVGDVVRAAADIMRSAREGAGVIDGTATKVD